MSNLLFFNKEGYPHNFQYNQLTEGYEGKILFDENSSDVFKTQSLHIFENVDPIDFGCLADFVKINYFNVSGLTIAGEHDFSNEIITNIIKINESDEFYTKWIYGSNFHTKFPKGSVVCFSGVTGTGISGLTDFSEDQYFTVLGVKKNAIMIITETSNDLYDFKFSSGYIKKSLNVISINDYNRRLSGDTFFQNLYEDKKFTILNSDLNDKVVSIMQTGQTVSYINEIKLNGRTGQIFTLSIQFFTERPILFQGNANLFKKDNVTYIYLGRVPETMKPEVIFFSGGTSGLTSKEIIFQDYTGGTLFNGYTFTIDSIVDTTFVANKDLTFKPYYSINTQAYTVRGTVAPKATQWNTIQFNGNLNISRGDVIRLSGITGSTLYNSNREFSISDVKFNASRNLTILFTPGYIISESGSTYAINKLLRPHQIRMIRVTPSGIVTEGSSKWELDTNCYSTSPVLNFNQYYTSGTTNSGIGWSTIDAFSKKYKTTLNQYGINIYPSPNKTDTLSVESLFGSKTKYFTASGYTNGTKIADDFSLSNNGLTQKYDLIINEKLSSEYSSRNDTNKLSKKSIAEIVLKLNYDIPVGTGTTSLGFRLTLNGIEYYAKFITDTQTTINTFISNFGSILYGNGFEVNSGYSSQYTGYTLNISTITPDLDIWDVEIMVNILSTYNIIEHQRNRGIVLSGNEIRSTASFFDIGLATGMILKISGSTYSENNKEYNIINLTDDTISLSYQGAFLSATSQQIIGKTREFIRKPRGEYNRDIYYKAYWEIPYNGVVDESIFFYDITGDQLTPYNNIENLRYTGPTPLIDPLSGNTVFLNKEPNKDITRIQNPKYQQTVFDELNFKLEQLDSSSSYNWIPEPLEIFVGYNTPNEGVNNRTLKIQKIEKFENSDILFAYTGYTISGSSFKNFTFNENTVTYGLPDFNFISYGFEKDQLIQFNFKDQKNKDEIIFENIGTYKILNVSRNKITIETGTTYGYSNANGDLDYSGYTTGFTYFSTSGATFYFKIQVQPKEILSCVIYGQTEIEDVRFKVNLNNVGVQLEDDAYQILYKSDIQDNAIDYTIFNQKRKEMLTNFREIYDYIGSYKSLINAINFFGYNDLQLYEYYQNIDQSSTLYGKLHKILIPDIFDNSVEGWHEMDFIGGKYQNQNTWKKSNLFNLAYRITDEEGNNVLIYTLEEVQYKLTKLKKWLRKNIIPISANLVDITGVADTKQTLYQEYDESNLTIKSVVDRDSTVVNFNYTSTLNFGSDYLITVNFYALSGATGTDIDINERPNYFTAKIKTFFLSGTTMIPVQYHKIIKNDLEPYSFNLDKNVDPYIYIETTTYDNGGSGLGFVNNKLFYFDEPRNHWLVNHNFDMTKFKYWQTKDFVNNDIQKWNYDGTAITYDDYIKSIENETKKLSNVVAGTVETNVIANTLNKTYTSTIYNNSI